VIASVGFDERVICTYMPRNVLRNPLWDPLVASFLVVIWWLFFELVFWHFLFVFWHSLPQQPPKPFLEDLGGQPASWPLAGDLPWTLWTLCSTEQLLVPLRNVSLCGATTPSEGTPLARCPLVLPAFCHFCVPRLGYILCANSVLDCHSVLERRTELWLCPACLNHFDHYHLTT
jgi:hypothetical protein